ncbi:DUF4421 family protein [Epilithonimonas hungarica]|uniref:DUF4421 domain-containing protein n=1 Tax=Epilithonimonas hungarica TaxID=454006 RepID=A0A1G7P488_9FLAO|nr:DUF4421 family protein [Epilithonimonas hungarica]SDF81073.1 protein of unknown function [Epilithonimonas hungarica]
MRILTFILLNFCVLTFAQNDSIHNKVISYDDKIILRLNFDTNIDNYVISSKGLDIKPRLNLNNKINTTIGFDYKIVSATVSFAPNFLQGNNNALKGKSSFTNYTFRFFPKNIIQTLSYKNSKGYYISNTQDFVSNWQKGKDPYLTFPNLRIQSFGGSTSYIFNKNFSLKGIYYQKEWQEASSGSFVPSINYEYVLFSDNLNSIKSREHQLDLSFDVGYYYNYVVTKHFNIAPFAFTGLGKKWSSYKADITKDEKEKQNFFTQNFGAGLHLGYNSENIFFGSKFNYSGNHYDDNGSNIINNNFYVLLFFGYRLNAPSKVKKVYEKIQDKIPEL